MEFKLENLSQDEVNLILMSLSELPYKVSFELISKIQQQGEKQYNEFRMNS
jgi:hypothetical protein